MSPTSGKHISLRDPIWQFISLIVTVIAALVSVYSVYDVYNRSVFKKDITISPTRVTPLITSDSVFETDITVLYNELPVKSVSIFGFAISNTGNTPLEIADQVRAITFSFPPNTQVVTATVLFDEPLTINPKLAITNQSQIIIEPLLLNPGDLFHIEIIAINIEDNTIPAPEVDGRIVGIKEIKTTSSSEQGVLLAGIRSAYNTEAMIVIPITTIGFSILLWRFPVFWNIIQQIFGHRPNTVWGRLSLNFAIATLVATVLEDIAEGVLKIIQKLI